MTRIEALSPLDAKQGLDLPGLQAFFLPFCTCLYRRERARIISERLFVHMTPGKHAIPALGIEPTPAASMPVFRRRLHPVALAILYP